MSQLSFASVDDQAKQKRAKHEWFLVGNMKMSPCEHGQITKLELSNGHRDNLLPWWRSSLKIGSKMKVICEMSA